MTKCECLVAGWCERHQINKSQMLHHKCQYDIEFWQAWEDGRGPKQSNPDKVKVLKLAGPGDFLARELYMRGYKVRRGCGCRDKVSKMNRWGLETCRKQIKTIEKWLEESAIKHSWVAWTALGLPVIREFVREKIRETIVAALDKYESAIALKASAGVDGEDQKSLGAT